MAEKRMFAKTIIDSDVFLEMPITSQLLYFHLSMRADDEGFVNSPKSIMRLIGAKDDDLTILAAKKFIIPFESGIVVIKHWKIHNYIRGDRLHETKYSFEKSMLSTDENNAYTLCQSNDGQLSGKCHTEIRLDKISIDKNSIDNNSDSSEPLTSPKKTKETKHKYGEYNHIMLTDKEYNNLIADYSETTIKAYIKKMDEYLEMNNRKPYKNYNLALRKWLANEKGVQNGQSRNGGRTVEEELREQGIGL